MSEQNSNPAMDANNENQAPGRNPEKFESDTQKVVRKHLENKDHVITEEEIASLRVGMVPPLDEATAARFEGDDAVEEAEEEITGDQDNIEESKNDRDNRLTPWDTVEND